MRKTCPNWNYTWAILFCIQYTFQFINGIDSVNQYSSSFLYTLFIFKGKNLKHNSTIHQIKVTVCHVKKKKHLNLKREWCQHKRKSLSITISVYHTIEMQVKILFYIICKVTDDLKHQHTGKKKVNIFPTNPSSEFRFESRSKDGWKRTCVFSIFFFFFFCVFKWHDLIILKEFCVGLGGFCSVQFPHLSSYRQSAAIVK